MLKIAGLAVWAAMIAGAERLRPATARPANETRVLRNLALWLANAAMNPLLTLPIAAGAAAFDPWTRPDLGWPGFVLDLLILDLWAWAWHVANHRVPLLWRFHEVHHRDAFLDATSAVRFHPGEVLISALARVPLIVALDIPFASIIVFDALLTASALFHHSNIRLPSRAETLLRIVIVTPSHHWVHHHARRTDTDSNYGVLLTVWDRLFGQWSMRNRAPDMEIGVEGTAGDLSLLRLVARPFAARG